MSILHPSIRGNLLPGMFAVHLRPQLKELYVFSLIYSFAYSLITIFEPVFFYQQGFSLSFIALYYALHYSIYVFVLPLGGKFIASFGIERALAISLPLFISYFLVLAAIPGRPLLVYLAIILLTAHKIFYWPAYHAAFAKFGDKNNRGTELSWMNLLKFGVGILGPLVGGFVAAFLGFPILFMFAAVLVLASAVPLLRTKERFRVKTFRYSAPWRLIISKTHRNMSLAMLGMGENLIDLVFWPVFLFIVLGSTSSMGVVTSISVAVMTLMSFFVGELADKLPRRIVLRLYLPFMAIGYLFRPFAATPLLALLTDTLGKMSFAGVNLPMVYRLYVQSKKAGVLEYVIAFEMVLAFAKAITAFALVIVFATLLPFTGFMVAFAAAAVLAIFYLFL